MAKNDRLWEKLRIYRKFQKVKLPIMENIAIIVRAVF